MEVSGIPTVGLLVRLNGSGGYVGTRRYDAQGSGGWLNPGDRIAAIAETPDQGVYLAGYRGDYPTGDVWLLRLDSAGSVLWQRLYGRTGDDEAAAAVALPDGGLVVAGRTTSFNLPAGAAWVFRLDAAGGVFPFCPPAGETTFDEGFGPPDIGVPGLLTIEQSIAAGSVNHQLASPTFASTAQCLGRPTEVSPPHSLRPLRFLDRERMEWEGAEANNASVFHLYRGDLGSPSDLGCFAPNLPTAAGSDPGTPIVGMGWSYLVTGDGAQGEGTMGYDSGGTSDRTRRRARDSDELLRPAPQLLDAPAEPAAHPDRVVVLVGHAEVAVEGRTELDRFEDRFERLSVSPITEPGLLRASPGPQCQYALCPDTARGRPSEGPK
jgi:hypothetical protein